jgi:hemerythrin-like domain-containing protein
MELGESELSRRGALAVAGLLSTGALVSIGGVLVPADSAAQGRKKSQSKQSKSGKGGEKHGGQDEQEKEVSATEDLMREHGVLRRTLIVYAESARVLHSQPNQIDPSALADAARLFRSFGENYHEKILEEQYVFPEVRQVGSDISALVDVLLRQHQRGREITDYIERVGSGGRIGNGQAEQLAMMLDAMTRMYNAHATWEDTVVFQAWRKQQPEARLQELSEKFEDIEHQQFGKDGFDDALQRIGRIEQTLGMADLDRYTAQAPPA